MDYRVLPWGVLDGTARCSLLSGCLVSGGRRAPPKVCYFRRFCHRVPPEEGDAQEDEDVPE